jgi:ABC-type amino acid transport system permease subunit
MLEGMLYTLWVAIPSIALSTIFGLLLAILSIAPTRLVRAPTCSTSSVTWSDAR